MLTATMPMAAVTMSMTVQPMRRTAEAAIGRAAIGLPVWTDDRLVTGAAKWPRHQAHRYRAYCGTSHQCQHHTTRAFHGCNLALRLFRGNVSFHHLAPRKQAKAGRFHGIVQRICQPPEKPKECEKEPNPPRCTPCEPVSEVPEDEWLADDESLE